MIEKSSPSFEQELFSLYSYGLPATSLRTECFNKLIGASSEREKREKLQLGMAAAPDYPVWLLKQAQEQAMVCLTHGEYVAIGYTSEEESSLRTIPAHEWSFLELNCERLLAEGGRRTYYGVRILRSANLRKQDWEVLGQGSGLISATVPTGAENWSDVALTLRAKDLIDVSIKGSSKQMFAQKLGLTDKRSGKANRSFVFLKALATGKKIPSNRKMVIAANACRKTLREYFGLTSDPIPHQVDRGYIAAFKVTDRSMAADERAKEKALRRTNSFDEQQHSLLVYDEHPYEDDLDDDASRWLAENEGKSEPNRPLDHK